ncbi:ribosome hibernation promoting factor [Candidatus Fukatsuia symbiotica]|uniref:Ribosome hibernation promoting factor n=1 Tax=Candidatus Fukatsuia symbiotica TaxID=1878942 RepID=A0A2U8I6Y6_9GAMM|nr:ribosome hibernation promoting factor [Candidatus Fukatsuia symbiotica]AWK14936.1 ribosomal subunit interface protein [Candidatus Fukatsuia symbiotica]MEA9445294.1 ribosome hibernation promoting factor [Candidatus Fukatsuia symbiotica]
MQLNITGHNIEITDSLRKFVTTKFNKLAKFEQYSDYIQQIYVTLSVEKVQQIAEATVHVHGGNLRATSEQEDMYAAIDTLIDKLTRQLRKHKDKLKKH